MKQILQFFLPDMRSVSLQEKALSASLAFVAALLCVYASGFFIDVSKEPVYIASMGAACVLLFATPNSPLAQPWPLIGSHLICSIIAVFCFQIDVPLALGIALATSASIFFMYVFRCLHPPGGAVAVAVILGSPEVQAMGYQFVFAPVLINVLLIFILALVINNLVPSRRYPNKAVESNQTAVTKLGVQKALYNQEDLELALEEMDSYIDVSRADLDRIYRLAVSHANQRRIGDVKCVDIMTKNVLTFEFSTELEHAWQVLHNRKLKAAPVIDSFNRVVGIVTIRDFVKHANLESQPGLFDQIQKFLQRTEGLDSDKLEVVGQIMSAPAYCVNQDQHIVPLLDIFSTQQIHHMPIIDDKKYLVGMITRSDLMRALAVLRS